MSLSKRILLLIFPVVLAGIGLFSLTAEAQEAEREGIGISPTALTLDADPGETIEGNFVVINGGTQPVRYRTYVRDFSVANEDYDRNFEQPIPGSMSPVSWFDVADNVGQLEARNQEKVNYSISVPKNAVPRGYYAVVFAETLPSDPDSTGVARVKRVGTLVYLTVNGGSVNDGKFLSFKSPRWQKDRTIETEIRLQNEGNVHFDAEGQVRLKDVFGRTVRSSDFRGTLLPSTIRRFTPSLQAGLPVGLYRVDGELKFLDDTVEIGSQWVLVASPLWLAIIILILIAWVALLVLWIRRRVRRKKS